VLVVAWLTGTGALNLGLLRDGNDYFAIVGFFVACALWYLAFSMLKSRGRFARMAAFALIIFWVVSLVFCGDRRPKRRIRDSILLNIPASIRSSVVFCIDVSDCWNFTGADFQRELAAVRRFSFYSECSRQSGRGQRTFAVRGLLGRASAKPPSLLRSAVPASG
jgi:hypothetical protein